MLAPGEALAAQAGSDDSVDMQLELRGRVASHCELALGRASTSANPEDHAGRETLPLSIDCNHPLTIEMRSYHGAMQHQAITDKVHFPGFASQLPYRATLKVNDGSGGEVSAHSEQMAAGAVRSLGTIPFKTSGVVQVDWNAEGILLAGTYSDTIEIRVVGDS